MVLLETPSRVWRRIDAAEGADMPSLPSLPAFDDSAQNSSEEGSVLSNHLDNHKLHNLSTVYSESDEDEPAGDVPVHSTPAPQGLSAFTGTGSLGTGSRFGTRNAVPSSTSSTARFASSIASRSMNGNAGRSGSHHHALSSLSRGTSASAVRGGELGESFDVSTIPSIRAGGEEGEVEEVLDDGGQGDEDDEGRTHSLRRSKDSVPDMYLPPADDEERVQDLSLTEALESVSRASSPFPLDDGPEFAQEYEIGEATPKKKYDYSVSLRSEPKVRHFSLFHLFHS